MPSKYANLRNSIPEIPSARDHAIEGYLHDYEGMTLNALTGAYNEINDGMDVLETQIKALVLQREAVSILIRQRLASENLDGATINGYTWTDKPSPHPVVDDPTAVVDHFLQQGQKDMLSVHYQRLASIVKEEARNNELDITVTTEVNPDTGEEVETTEVRSRIPGVRVYLRPGLSRVKSSKGAQ